MRCEDAAEVVLEGVLIAAAWGLQGEILEVRLMTFDENQYRIDPSAVDRHGLKGLVRKHVRLTALIREDRVIRVKRCEICRGTELDTLYAPDEGFVRDE